MSWLEALILIASSLTVIYTVFGENMSTYGGEGVPSPYAPHVQPNWSQHLSAPPCARDNDIMCNDEPVTIHGRKYYLNEMTLQGLQRILKENFDYSQDLLTSITTPDSARIEISKTMGIADAVEH